MSDYDDIDLRDLETAHADDGHQRSHGGECRVCKLIRVAHELTSRAERAEAERDAVANAGHRDDCAGYDEIEHRCGCGWLQGEGAHQYIQALRAELADARAEAADWELKCRQTGRQLCERGDILREVAICGEQPFDERMSYHVVHIDNETWDELAAYRVNG